MPDLVLRNKQFPNNSNLQGGSNLTVTPSSNQSVNSSLYLSLPDPAHPGQFINYQFLFWNVLGALNSGINTSPSIVINVGSANVTATAWYIAVGGIGEPGIWALAFGQAADTVDALTPIGSVNPSSAWAGGNSTFATTKNSAIDVTMVGSLGGVPYSTTTILYGTATIGGEHVMASKGNSALVLVSYMASSSTVVPIGPLQGLMEAVQGIKDKIKQFVDPSPEDFIRIYEQVRKGQVATTVVDDLSTLVGQMDKMNVEQLKRSLVSLDGRIARDGMARTMVQDTIEAKNGAKK